MGAGLVLISCPPVQGPKRDLYTGQIAEEVALLSRSWGMIARETKHDPEDVSAGQVGYDFDKSVGAFVGEYGIKCIIMILGTSEPGIMIKVHPDDSVSEEILEIIRSGLEPHFSTNSSTNSSTDSGTEHAGNGAAKVTDPGAEEAPSHRLPIVRLELGPEERGFMKDQFVSNITDIIGLINTRLGFSESTPRSGPGVSTDLDTTL